MKKLTSQFIQSVESRYLHQMSRFSSVFNFFFVIFMVLFIAACNTKEKTSADSIRTEVAEVRQSLFIIEREMPGAGNLSPEQLMDASKLSNGVLSEMGPDIKWLHSYVTDDKIYCVYTATNEDKIREHALKSGFPANSVSIAGTVIDPSTGY